MNPLESLYLPGTSEIITRLGMGCWAVGGHGWGKVDDNQSIAAVKYALDCGVSLFDTADVYGLGKSEKILSKALGEKRKEVVIASKGGVRWDSNGKIKKDCSPQYLRTAVEASLKRLQLDCIPIYFIHWPDNVTPINESVGVLDSLRKQGKIEAIGLSNFSPVQVLEASQQYKIDAVQIECSLLENDKAYEMVDVCNKENIITIAWGVLAGGLLTGKFGTKKTFNSDDHRSRDMKYQDGTFQKNLKIVDQLRPLAHHRHVGLSQLALRWVLDEFPSAYALFGAKSPQQVSDNIKSCGWSLSHEELKEIKKVISR